MPYGQNGTVNGTVKNSGEIVSPLSLLIPVLTLTVR